MLWHKEAAFRYQEAVKEWGEQFKGKPLKHIMWVLGPQHCVPFCKFSPPVALLLRYLLRQPQAKTTDFPPQLQRLLVHFNWWLYYVRYINNAQHLSSAEVTASCPKTHPDCTSRFLDLCAEQDILPHYLVAHCPPCCHRHGEQLGAGNRGAALARTQIPTPKRGFLYLDVSCGWPSNSFKICATTRKTLQLKITVLNSSSYFIGSWTERPNNAKIIFQALWCPWLAPSFGSKAAKNSLLCSECAGLSSGALLTHSLLRTGTSSCRQPAEIRPGTVGWQQGCSRRVHGQCRPSAFSAFPHPQHWGPRTAPLRGSRTPLRLSGTEAARARNRDPQRF